jgi:hypothetical protein
VSKKSQDQKILESAMNILCEHYDSVQIFVTRHEPVTENGTVEFDCGIGNYFARIGQINMWLKRQEASANDWVFEMDAEDAGFDDDDDDEEDD